MCVLSIYSYVRVFIQKERTNDYAINARPNNAQHNSAPQWDLKKQPEDYSTQR